MKNGYKKIAAGMAAIVCAASLSGCADSGYLMEIADVQIRNGIYLSYQFTQAGNAKSKVSQAKEEAGEDTTIDDLFAEQIDGVPVSDWIKSETMLDLRRYVAIQKLAEADNIALTDEERNEINSEINEWWDAEDMYAQYIYGTNTMGEYYESIGIGKESVRDLNLNEALGEKLFKSYYDKDGSIAVSDEDYNAYLTDNYASVFVLKIPYEDYQGITVTEENKPEAYAEIRATAQSYADRINAGESIIDIKYAADLVQAQNAARVEAEDAYAEITAEGEMPDFDSYVQEAVDKATAVKAESESGLITVFNKENSSFDEVLTDFIWNSAADGKAAICNTYNNDACCVIVRYDVTKNAEWNEDNRLTVLTGLKGDEFEELLKTTGSSYSVTMDEHLVNKKYAPENMKGID